MITNYKGENKLVGYSNYSNNYRYYTYSVFPMFLCGGRFSGQNRGGHENSIIVGIAVITFLLGNLLGSTKKLFQSYFLFQVDGVKHEILYNL